MKLIQLAYEDESWYRITFIQTIIDESVIVQEANRQWNSTTMLIDKFAITHPAYLARVYWYASCSAPEVMIFP
jgi:hypothetical protein